MEKFEEVIYDQLGYGECNNIYRVNKELEKESEQKSEK